MKVKEVFRSVLLKCLSLKMLYKKVTAFSNTKYLTFCLRDNGCHIGNLMA